LVYPARKTIIIFFSFFIINTFSSKAQTSTTRVDGKTISSKISFYKKSEKNRESSTADYIRFYQKYISEIRGQECPMYPSCSNFGLKAFKETSFTTAFILTSDRLLRCGHDFKNYSLTLRENGFKNLDYPIYDDAPKELYYTGNSYYYAYSDTLKDSNLALGLVKSLLNDALYNEALLEIKRIQYLHPVFNAELFVNELICLRATGEFEKAIYSYEVHCPETFKDKPEILYQLATVYYNLDNYDKALEIVNKSLVNTDNKYLKAKSLSFQGVLYAHQYDWKNALSTFESLDTNTFSNAISKDKIRILKSSLPLKQKKPAVAALLSIIPGAGYAYSGHKQTAISAFIINGLLTYATYSNLKNKNYGMSALTGVFNLSFYIGNIYGSSKSAMRYNSNQKQNLCNKLIYNLKP